MEPELQLELPVQPVEKPILCNPYLEPHDHWMYDRQTGTPRRAGFRGRPPRQPHSENLQALQDADAVGTARVRTAGVAGDGVR